MGNKTLCFRVNKFAFKYDNYASRILIILIIYILYFGKSNQFHHGNRRHLQVEFERDMLKEFNDDAILKETVRFGIFDHDSELEEGIESGVDREVTSRYFLHLEGSL